MLFRHLIPGIIWGVVIAFLCGLPGNSMPDLSFWSILTFDKFAHASVFAIFTYLLAIGFKKQRQVPFVRIHGMKLSFGIGIGYGVLLEMLQFLIFVRRSAEWPDMFANAFGCFLGILVFYLIFGKVIDVG